MNILCLAYRRPFTEHGLAFSKTFGKQTDSKIHLLYVAKYEKGRVAGEEALNIARKNLGKIKVQSELQIGNAQAHLEEAIQNFKIDFLVAGTLSGVNLLAGQRKADLRRLVWHAPISTFVVRQAPEALKRVLICTGGLKASVDVIETGAKLAKSLGAEATLLYVASAVPSMYTGLEGVEEELGQLLETDTPVAQCLRTGAEILDTQGLKAELKLRHGIAAEQILREADDGGYDLIVVGASKSSRRIVLGDVTNEVVGGASSPVLIVK